MRYLPPPGDWSQGNRSSIYRLEKKNTFPISLNSRNPRSREQAVGEETVPASPSKKGKGLLLGKDVLARCGEMSLVMAPRKKGGN